MAGGRRGSWEDRGHSKQRVHTTPNSLFHAAQRFALLATQAVKGADHEGRGNPCAALRSAPGLREQTERYLKDTPRTTQEP